MKYLPKFATILLSVLPLAVAQEPVRQNVGLSKVNGRHWLVGPDGKPFFAHGITHVNTKRAKFDFTSFSKQCKEIGFNAYGYGCPPQLRNDMPYIESWNHLVPISTYRGKNVKYIDIFDPKEQKRLERGVRVSCERALKHPRNLIGYCWTDLGAWPLKNSTKTNWVEYIRGLPDEAPGKKAYDEFLSTWNRDSDQARDREFLRLIAREYFRVVGDANRKYAPDHLIFGDRFAFNTFDEAVVKEMLPYVDAIAIQPQFWGPFPKKKFDEIYRLTGKPILLCDFAIRFKDGDKEVRMWNIADDSADAGKQYTDYVKAALKTDYILGTFWCNPVDTTKGFGKPGVKQGFFGDGLTERAGLHASVKQLNEYRDEVTPDDPADEAAVPDKKAAFTPKIHNENIATIKLFAQNPDIVTPVGIAVAPDGRVFVQENHTHKRKADYDGPETDRILVFEDTDNDGVADKQSVFYEGHTFSTDLLFGPDGHLYVSTRWFVGRFPNAATKEKADGEPEKLVVCKTDGDYPHNGVGGLAIDPADPDWLAFGFGENLGVAYTFVGTDGTEFSGEAEGGSTYRCRTDGTKLTKLSTGHWNAFGMCYDLAGNLYSTDNDPNATPPNRLLHVVPGADFGYEYRYGRSGRHPLVAWYGENPGTIGMIGALGEAACGLVPHGANTLLSASWTDNRVDLHTLKPQGASFKATREPFLSGPDDFRPVHFAYSPDGKYLYFTDWVKISYPVHGFGRVWRVEFKEPIDLKPSPRSENTPRLAREKALAMLGSSDPYERTRVMHAFTKHPELLDGFDWKAANATARAHYGVTLKRIDPTKNANVIPELLADSDPEVRFVGIKWIADQKLTRFRPQLEEMLERPNLTRRDLRATLAALARLAGDAKKEFSPDDKLAGLALDQSKPPKMRAIALQTIGENHKRLTVPALIKLAASEHAAIREEAIRLVVLHNDPARGEFLSAIAVDDSLDPNLRADAIAGLASVASGHQELLKKLAGGENKIVAAEATRALVGAKLSQRALEAKPPIEDIDAWQTLVESASGDADPSVGRRLFFHSAVGGCYKCHAMNGRGNAIGPELTTIHKQDGITSKRLLQHIVNPSAEMAPYYRPQTLLTTDGKVLTGLIAGREGQKQGYVGSDGVIFYVNKDDVEERQELTTSIMPSGLLNDMTADEIRDLLAYLLSPPRKRAIQGNTVINWQPRANSSAPQKSQDEMFASLALTDEQHTKFRALEAERKAMAEKFGKMSGNELKDAQHAFYSQRREKLKVLFTKEQWEIWSNFWTAKRN